MSRKVNTSYTPAQVKGAFKVFERDCPSGFVSMAALEQALTTYGSEKLSLNDAQAAASCLVPPRLVPPPRGYTATPRYAL